MVEFYIRKNGSVSKFNKYKIFKIIFILVQRDYLNGDESSTTSDTGKSFYASIKGKVNNKSSHVQVNGTLFAQTFLKKFPINRDMT